MAVIASVHIADLGSGSRRQLFARTPKPGSIPGLRKANLALVAPLGATLRRPPPIGRVGLIAFWDGEEAASVFESSDHPLAATFAGGWRAHLEPLRAYGSWPGLPADVPSTRATDHTGPAIVLTLGRLRFSQVVRFLRTNSKAEKAVVGAPGLLWASGLARPPFVATCSLWSSTRDLSTYAYGTRDPGHPDAVAAQVAKPFHHESAFVRFRVLSAAGSLDGRNPLTPEVSADVLTRR